MGSSSPKEKSEKEKNIKKNENDSNKNKLEKQNKNKEKLEKEKIEEEIKIKLEKEKIEEKKKKEEEERKIKEEEEKRKLEEERKKIEEETKRKEEERKKEEIKQEILRQMMEEETVIKIKFTNEEFINYIIQFFEEFIQIFYSLPKKGLYISLIFEFNKTYIYSFDKKEYPDIPQRENFFEILKYTSVIVVCLIFMSKDLDLYKKFNSKIKEPIEKFLFSIINIVGRNILKGKTITGFIKNFKKAKKDPILCINDIIKILFVNGKNAPLYKNLKNALTQVLGNITTEPIDELMIRINESILFFYNADSYIINKNNLMQSVNTETSTPRNIKPKTNRSRSKSKKKETKKEEKITPIITDPFINEPMVKDFCLVLDIDETISHTMRLSFGNYFLLRPGVVRLIKKLYNFYEIDIFTAAIKRYADNIVNKLDPNDNYIRYRFYREHCIYEGTKTVKKLVRIGRDLNKIIFVDNIKYNAKYNMDNLYHVSSWKDNVYDTEMIKLQDLLVDIMVNGLFKDDIRKGIAGKDDQAQPVTV